MARTQYFVVLHEHRWKVRLGDQHSDPYLTQRDAIRHAIDAAHKEGQEGNETQVLVESENHQFRTEWTYGRDPYLASR